MDFMELLELVQSLALMFAGAAVLGVALRFRRVEDNALEVAIAQSATESYATRRFSEVSAEIGEADKCAQDAHFLAMKNALAFIAMREAFTDDGR